MQVEYQKALVYGATGKHDVSEISGTRVSTLPPRTPRTHLQLARRSLLRVLSVAPGEPAVLMQLGKACKHLGLFEEAVRCL